MGKRETKWHETNRLNPFRPNEGQISSDRKHVWNGKKWVKYIGPPKKVKISSEEFFGTGTKYGHGGSKDVVKNKKDNNTNNKSKTTPKKGPVVKSVGTIDFNINTPAGLTSYNKAKKAALNAKTDKEKDKAANVALKEERNSNRNKISANKKGGKKGNNFTTNVHTRHYKTGERLGVMTRNERRAYEKAAGGKTFEQRVAEHEKTSGHGQPHLRETKYKASVRRGGNNNSSSNKGSSTSNKGSTNRTKLKGKSAYDMKLKTNVTDSKVYGKKKKKKNNNLTKDEIKYPTRGTFRGI